MNTKELRLLVVDDHAAQRHIVAQMLRLLGVGVVSEAGSGYEALQCMAQSPLRFHAVLSDLDMPSGDGLELARGVRARSSEVPVTLMSAIDDGILAGIESLRGEGSRLVDQVIRKPVSLAALREWIDGLVDRRVMPDAPELRIELADLNSAIRDRQIRPWFEPQMQLDGGTLLGFEALARWHHPEHGVVSPACFIPVVEGTPLLVDLTLSMLDQALLAMSPLPGALRLSLNVGMACLEDPTFAARAWQSLDRCGVAASRITFEITESASMNDTEAVVTSLARLRMRGFELSVDDFGTGFASLRQFTFGAYSEVKIDRQFVARVIEDRTSRAAVGSIAALASGLGMRCVAEGIERIEVLDATRSMGCTVGQGWLWSKPIPAPALPSWVESYA